MGYRKKISNVADTLSKDKNTITVVGVFTIRWSLKYDFYDFTEKFGGLYWKN